MRLNKIFFTVLAVTFITGCSLTKNIENNILSAQKGINTKVDETEQKVISVQKSVEGKIEKIEQTIDAGKKTIESIKTAGQEVSKTLEKASEI